MLYVPFLADIFFKNNSQQGDRKCASGGGGQHSMVKDHKMTIFLGPFPYQTLEFFIVLE